MTIFSRILNRFMARKTKVSLSLTPEAVTVLDDLATQLSVSRSGLVEQLAQGHLAVKAPAAQQGAALMLGSEGVSVTPFDPSFDPPKEEPPTGEPPKGEIPATATALGEPPEEPSTEADAPAAYIPEGNTPEEDASAIAPPAEPEMAGDADAPSADQADQPQEPTAAAAGMAPVPPPEPPHPQADPVPALQSQLLAAIAAQDTLKAQAQAQAQELTQLRQELAQQRSLALLGERQINRWRYYTYSR